MTPTMTSKLPRALTQSEIESLRQDMRESSELMKAEIKARRASTLKAPKPTGCNLYPAPAEPHGRPVVP